MDLNYEVKNSNQFDRVRNSTDEDINEQIDRVTNTNIDYYSTRPAWEVKQRIIALEKEWDTERVLEVNASTLALTGLVLGLTVNKKWLALPAVVLPFLLQHGLQGWCPPLPILRRMGIRTRDEIDREKYSLLESLKSRPD
ncbi:MAG: hypothetical protein ACAH08_07560 [Methylophilus sp.]|uniref:hypothetical protein n=1 Tax=Methylophilus sp. TaxID=29541 RepID=UPI002C19ABE2|nr:hypothetical protein [Methylophilus sp.]HSH87192.1 hypothetical protein [Methylophilus sp.]